MRLKPTQNRRNLFKEISFKSCIFALIIFFNYNVFSQTTYNITSPAALTTTFSTTLMPGDIVILADGTYSASATMKFNGVGTAALPITLKAATPGGVKLTGGQTLKIGGEYCIIEGFHWLGGFGASNFIEFRDGNDLGNNSIIQNCVINGLGVSGGNPQGTTSIKHNWIVMYGNYNTVINCSFMNKISSGNMILADLSYNAVPGTSSSTTNSCNEVGHTISNNYFYNYSKIDATLTNAGDSEAIRIGTSSNQNVNSNAIVNYNYFVQADGENEIITNKSKGNTYTNNTFRRCRGSLVLRHGSHTTVDGNYFLGENIEGTGGIRIVDSYQTVKNNYIKDCVNEFDQGQWNNGITFLGGNDTSAVLCSSTSMTNGYQKVTNLNLNNNTIVNTREPLYYNEVQGSTDPLGNVTNNLIYFTPGNQNLTPVINADYAGLGTALTYNGNVFKGTTLGATNPNFTELTDPPFTATLVGEIYEFTGTDKGATMNSAPITDSMVGYGIGACFVNNLGINITNGTCNIVIPETLIVGSLSPFTHVAGSKNVSVTANVSWTAMSNDSWITIDTPSGTSDATVLVTVTENTGAERTGTVTFTQAPGGDDSVRTLNITQDAPPPPDPRDGLTLINYAGDPTPVDVFNVCHEEIPPNHTKDNYAWKSLDKDLGTLWAGSAALGTCIGDRVVIIYDLKDAFDLQLVDIATTSGKTYKLQIEVTSNANGIDGYTNPFPSGDLLSNQDASFKAFVLPAPAIGTRFVKIIGNGQVESTTSRYTSIHEIEFYGDSSILSIGDKDLANQIIMYPNPAKDFLTLKNIKNNVNLIQVFSVDGRKVLEKTVKSSESDIKLDVSSISNGTYILNISDGQSKQSKMIIVSH